MKKLTINDSLTKVAKGLDYFLSLSDEEKMALVLGKIPFGVFCERINDLLLIDKNKPSCGCIILNLNNGLAAEYPYLRSQISKDLRGKNHKQIYTEIIHGIFFSNIYIIERYGILHYVNN